MTPYSYVAYQSSSEFLEWKFHISVGLKLKDAARSSLHPREGTGTSSPWHAPLAASSLSLLPPSPGCPEHHPYWMAASHPEHLTYIFGFYAKSWGVPKHYRGQHCGLSGFTAFIHQNLIDLPKIKQRAGLNGNELEWTRFFVGVFGFTLMNNILMTACQSEKSLSYACHKDE